MNVLSPFLRLLTKCLLAVIFLGWPVVSSWGQISPPYSLRVVIRVVSGQRANGIPDTDAQSVIEIDCTATCLRIRSIDDSSPHTEMYYPTKLRGRSFLTTTLIRKDTGKVYIFGHGEVKETELTEEQKRDPLGYLMQGTWTDEGLVQIPEHTFPWVQAKQLRQFLVTKEGKAECTWWMDDKNRPVMISFPSTTWASLGVFEITDFTTEVSPDAFDPTKPQLGGPGQD